MSNFNTVLNVLECNHAAPNLLVRRRGLTRGKQMFEDLTDALSKRSSEAFEKEMWVRLRDGAA